METLFDPVELVLIILAGIFTLGYIGLMQKEKIDYPFRWRCELCSFEVKTNDKEALMRVVASHRHEVVR